MIQDMKRNIQMRNMGFTSSKLQTVVQPDFQSGCKEYKDLKSDRCIANADIQSKRIANPLEQDIQMRNMGFTERKQHTNASETAYLRGGNGILSSRHLRSLILLLLTMTLGATEAWGQFFC